MENKTGHRTTQKGICCRKLQAARKEIFVEAKKGFVLSISAVGERERGRDRFYCDGNLFWTAPFFHLQQRQAENGSKSTTLNREILPKIRKRYKLQILKNASMFPREEVVVDVGQLRVHGSVGRERGTERK